MLGHRKRTLLGGRIADVEPGSIGEEIGVEPGDVLVSINGHPLRDVIDFQFYGSIASRWSASMTSLSGWALLSRCSMACVSV
jgi:type II secretory pathway component PulC